MANPVGTPPANPFDHAFEMLGSAPRVTTDHINADALELLTQALTSRAAERGRMVLLRSPRAGFGKTHLLMRLHQRVAHSHEFIPLEPTKGRYLDAQSVLDAVLRRFSRVLPAGGGLTVLDLLARRILATGLEPLVRSGEVPSQDRDSALQALQQRPVETFDFHNEEAVTARWAMANFSLLGPRLTAELAERTHSGYRPVAWWVELLFRYSSAGIDQTSRNSSLFETVFGGESVETDIHEKLVALLNLTGLVTSPVLILDEVEGFSSNPEAALQVATFLNALHQSCNKLTLIISVNGDVWETAFLPRLPCGLKDRLSDIVVDLKPMQKEDAIALLRDRAGDRAEAIADTMDFDTGVIYARGLIREAASAWGDAVEAEYEAGSESLQEPISLLEPEAPEPESEPVQLLNPVDLHAPAEVVVPHVIQEPDFQAESEVEPSPAELEAPISLYNQSSQEVEQPVSPELPDDLPRPFAQSAEPAPTPAEVPHFGPPAESAPAPRVTNVVNSPFSIDTKALAAKSPFQSSQPDAAVQPPQSGDSAQPASSPPAESPFQVETETPTPHAVTENDHEKVEDLLKQFRNRFGRD